MVQEEEKMAPLESYLVVDGWHRSPYDVLKEPT